MVDNPNPGNFHNRPHEEVENIARKGGQSSHHSGFASMDANKQVSKSSLFPFQYKKLTSLWRGKLLQKAATLHVENLSQEAREPRRQVGKEVDPPISPKNKDDDLIAWQGLHCG